VHGFVARKAEGSELPNNKSKNVDMK